MLVQEQTAQEHFRSVWDCSENIDLHEMLAAGHGKVDVSDNEQGVLDIDTVAVVGKLVELTRWQS